ncbi:MAG: hypothetical protein ACRDC6_09145 [Shewanella sp.]
MKNVIWITTALAVLFSYPAAAQIKPNISKENELRIRLKNDFRRADKPSAGAGRQIYAWVQGGALDFSSAYFPVDTEHDIFLSVDAGAYYVYKLGARGDMSTRSYLQSDYQSFGLTLGSVKLNYGNSFLKIGSFVTDTSWGVKNDLPYSLPLIDATTVRTLPSISEGALAYVPLTENIDSWWFYRTGQFNYYNPDAKIRKEGFFSPPDDLERHPSYIGAISYGGESGRYSIGIRAQEDVATSFMLKADSSKFDLANNNDKWMWQLMTFYGVLDGKSQEQPDIIYDDTTAISGQVTYFTGDWSFYANAGYLSHKQTAIDTDLGFPYSLSIERNHEGMQSYQVGATYQALDNLTVFVAPIITDGYESQKRDIKVKGKGVNVGMIYKPLSNLTWVLMADRMYEDRDGSSLGDKLDYWDIKSVITYDFTL